MNGGETASRYSFLASYSMDGMIWRFLATTRFELTQMKGFCVLWLFDTHKNAIYFPLCLLDLEVYNLQLSETFY